jgi:hypothetical protein
MNVATSGVVCLFMFLFSYKHFKIGGEWKRMVTARIIDVGDVIRLYGRPNIDNKFIHLSLYCSKES